MAMALGAAQQHEHDTHADKHKHVRELKHACTIKCSILTEAFPESTMGTTPHAAHMVASAVCSMKSSTVAVTSGVTRWACAKHMLTAVVKAGEMGQAALAQEAECEGARRAGIGNGEGGVAQLSR